MTWKIARGLRRDWALAGIISCLGILVGSCLEDGTVCLDRRGATLSGTVYLDSSRTQKGVLVRLIQTSDSTFTDARGHYSFPLKRRSDLTIVASYDSYEPFFIRMQDCGSCSCEAPDIVLSPVACLPEDSIPAGYPLRVYFCSNVTHRRVTSYRIGDSLFVVADESSGPPSAHAVSNKVGDYDDMILYSSLGDREVTPLYEYLGSVPELWKRAYIIGTAGTTAPERGNGILEVEPSGGWIVAMYHSWWFESYVCGSIPIVQ